MTDGAWVDLADAIEGLRSGLTEAIDRGQGQRMHFRVSQPITLTLQAELQREGRGEAKAGVKWRVLLGAEAGISASGSVGSTSTQSLTLTLQPVWTAPDGQWVDDPLISASLDPAEGSAPAGAPDEQDDA